MVINWMGHSSLYLMFHEMCREVSDYTHMKHMLF